MALPTSEPAKRLHALFNRRPDTHWDVKEIGKFRQLTKQGAFNDPADLALIERYTLSERKKGDFGRHRRALAQVLNNWRSELDKAREWEEKHPLKKAPRKIIPLPLLQSSEPYIADATPEELARFQQAREERKRARGFLL